jgi:hypothetical protein
MAVCRAETRTETRKKKEVYMNIGSPFSATAGASFAVGTIVNIDNTRTAVASSAGGAAVGFVQSAAVSGQQCAIVDLKTPGLHTVRIATADTPAIGAALYVGAGNLTTSVSGSIVANFMGFAAKTNGETTGLVRFV